MQHYVTPDLCDAYPDVAVVEPMFSNFGGHDSFGGQIVTVDRTPQIPFLVVEHARAGVPYAEPQGVYQGGGILGMPSICCSPSAIHMPEQVST